MAGWVFSVSLSSSSGPSKISRESGKPRASSASAKVWGGDEEFIGEFAAHAYGLRTLPRKEKSQFFLHFREDCILPDQRE